MKQRKNQLVAIQCRMVDPDLSDLDISIRTLQPLILSGGPFAEQNRQAMIENLKRIYGGDWTTRIVYRWRNRQHLTRYLASGVKWRGGRRP